MDVERLQTGPVTQLIKRRLAIVFSLLGILFLVAIGMSAAGLNAIKTHANQIVAENNLKLDIGNRMLDALQTRRYALFIYAHLEDDFARQDNWEVFNGAASDYLTARNFFLAQKLSVDDRQALAKLDQLTQTGQLMQLEVVRLVEAEEFQQAREVLLADARPAQDAVIDQINQLVQLQKINNQLAQANADQVYQQVLIALALLSLVIAIVATAAAVIIIRSTTHESSEVEFQQRKFKALFDASHDAVTLWSNWKLMEYNEAAEKMLLIDSYTHESLSLHELLPDVQPNGERTEDVLNIALGEADRSGNYAVLEITLYRTDKTPFPAELHISLVELDGHKIVQTVARDISERKQAESEIAWLAYFDQLTKLPNESLLLDRIQVALNLADEEVDSLALACFSLPQFDQITEALGRETGQDLLTEVARLLSKQLKDGDTLARTGDREFVLLINKVADARYVERLVHRALQSFAVPIAVDDHMLQLNLSTGIAMFPQHGVTASMLMQNSRSASKKAQESEQPDVIFYDAGSHQPAYRNLTLSNAIVSAIQQDQFYMAYQPKFDLETLNVVGMEALCRWNHPTLGEISPEEFIPLAEANGSIIPLGEWVLLTALDHIKEVNAMTAEPLTLAVNVSMKQCQDAVAMQRLQEMIANYIEVPLHLELEITESLSNNNEKAIHDRLIELREQSVRIAIDDFGTGYSALSQLHQMPVDVLKIDKSFVIDLENNPDHRELIRMIVSIGKQFGHEVVAEGAETQVHVDFLRECGCDTVQGFYLGEPMTAENFKQFLRARVEAGFGHAL